MQREFVRSAETSHASRHKYWQSVYSPLNIYHLVAKMAAEAHPITAANREYFDAHRMETGLQAKIADLIVKSIVDSYIFDEEETVVLDFACGIGMTMPFYNL